MCDGVRPVVCAKLPRWLNGALAANFNLAYTFASPVEYGGRSAKLLIQGENSRKGSLSGYDVADSLRPDLRLST